VDHTIGSRERAPDDELIVPTGHLQQHGGHGATAPLPTLQGSQSRLADQA
jgi:hypothetical protein